MQAAAPTRVVTDPSAAFYVFHVEAKGPNKTKIMDWEMAGVPPAVAQRLNKIARKFSLSLVPDEFFDAFDAYKKRAVRAVQDLSPTSRGLVLVRKHLFQTAGSLAVSHFDDFRRYLAGDDLDVYLCASPNPTDADIKSGHRVGLIRGGRGEQKYVLPSDLDLDQVGSIVIYARTQHRILASASLGLDATSASLSGQFHGDPGFGGKVTLGFQSLAEKLVSIQDLGHEERLPYLLSDRGRDELEALLEDAYSRDQLLLQFGDDFTAAPSAKLEGMYTEHLQLVEGFVNQVESELGAEVGARVRDMLIPPAPAPTRLVTPERMLEVGFRLAVDTVLGGLEDDGPGAWKVRKGARRRALEAAISVSEGMHERLAQTFRQVLGAKSGTQNLTDAMRMRIRETYRWAEHNFLGNDPIVERAIEALRGLDRGTAVQESELASLHSLLEGEAKMAEIGDLLGADLGGTAEIAAKTMQQTLDMGLADAPSVNGLGS